MKALADLLSQRSAFAVAGMLTLAALAWVLMVRVQADPDFWWHLRVAEYVRDTGDVPRSDFISWQVQGEPWIAHSWLHDLSMWASYSIGGLTGVALLGALVAAIVIALLYLLFTKLLPESAPVVRATGILAVAILAAPVWSPRAQIWDVVFILAAVIGWLTYRDSGRRAWLVAMVPLGWAWAALHGSGIAAYGVSALALAVAVALGWLPKGRRRLPLALSIGATLIAMAAGPYGPALLLYPFETVFSSAQARLIEEWAAPDLASDTFVGLRLAIIGVPALLVIGRRHPDRLLGILAVGWAWLALGSGRYLALAAPFVIGSVLPSLDALRARWLRRRPAPVSSPAAATAAVLFVAASLIVVALFRISPVAAETMVATKYPVAVSQALSDQGCTGRLWNVYEWGGYLSYHWRQPVGAYGAADSLGDRLLEAYEEEAKGGRAFDEMLRRDDVGLVALRPGSPPTERLATMPNWVLVTGDDVAELWSQRGSCQ